MGISETETQKIIDGFFASKPKVKEFIEETHKFVEETGYVDTMQGHRRLLMGAKTKEGKSDALRQSVNTIIQGTGAYLTNMSVILLDEYLVTHNKRSQLIATVHDSILIDIPEDEIEEVIPVAKFIMENLPIDFLNIPWEGSTIRYPIKADAEVGTTYKDVVEYDEELFKEFNSVKGYTKYFKDLGKFDDYAASGLITKEQKLAGEAMVESQIEHYKQMA